MLKLLYCTTAFFLIACFITPVEAADNKKNSGTLVLIHRKGLIENQTYRAAWDRLTLEPEIGLELRSTEEITLVVKDPNPLLFTYAFNGVKEADTVDYQNATKFAGALNSLVSILSGAQRAAGATAGISGQSLQLRAETLGKEMFNKRSWSELTAAERDEATVAAEIKAVLDGLPPRFFDDLRQDTRAVSANITLLPELISRSAGDEQSVARVKLDVEGWRLDLLAQRMDSAFKKMDDVQAKILDITSRGSLEDLDSVDPRILAILVAKDQQFRIEKMIETLQSFQKDALAIDQQLTLGTFGYSPTKVKTATFEIKPVAANAKIAETTKRKTGTFSIVAEPLSAVHYGFGGAMVYSFIKKPQFVAEPVATGGFKIVRKPDPGYIGQNVAGVLTITPRAWSDPTFGGQFQFGFNPTKDEVAFFLGAGFRVFNLAHIGAGWTFQQVPKLTGSLKVNDPIQKADDLKTTTEFKSGVYLFLSVSTK